MSHLCSPPVVNKLRQAESDGSASLPNFEITLVKAGPLLCRRDFMMQDEIARTLLPIGDRPLRKGDQRLPE
jgi:hypothetical protein